VPAPKRTDVVAEPISLPDAVEHLTQAWHPVDIVRANDAIVRLARLDGSFEWHAHDEDELFLCWSGEFRIELDGRKAIEMAAGDLFVVPVGIRHRPVAEHGPAYAILLERPETLQYGNPAPEAR
jgi:mannose-6-phosphate isomerase-like protein (cupin superfamily)